MSPKASFSFNEMIDLDLFLFLACRTHEATVCSNSRSGTCNPLSLHVIHLDIQEVMGMRCTYVNTLSFVSFEIPGRTPP